MPVFGRVPPVTRRYWIVVEATVGVEEAIAPAAEASMRVVRVELL